MWLSRLFGPITILFIATVTACVPQRLEQSSADETQRSANQKSPSTQTSALEQIPSLLLSRYIGAVPCVDCVGIRTELLLYVEETSHTPAFFKLHITHLATPEEDKTFTTVGHWRIVNGSAGDPEATIYQLVFDQPGETSDFLKVGDDELRLLDREKTDLRPSLSLSLMRVRLGAADESVTLTARDAGINMELPIGRELVIKLPSNRTTGYRWMLVSSDEGRLISQGVPFYVEPSNPNVIGAEGVEIWRLLAMRPGQQTLRFEYRRPWEGNTRPARVAWYFVTVR